MRDILVPPLKIQGVKTRLVPWIREQAGSGRRWVEPFLGSGVVAFNMPSFRHMLLGDANRHVVRFFQWLRGVDARTAVRRLRAMGRTLFVNPDYYYEIRDKYNAEGDPVNFLFLSRTCFNGVMRFSSKDKFNTPFCKNPGKLSPELLDNLLLSLENCRRFIKDRTIEFVDCDWAKTLSLTDGDDVIYCDPPYSGRETGYIGRWTEKDDLALMEALQGRRYLVSSWISDGVKENPVVAEWERHGAAILRRDHQYMVGPKGSLRPKVVEALIVSPSMRPDA